MICAAISGPVESQRKEHPPCQLDGSEEKGICCRDI